MEILNYSPSNALQSKYMRFKAEVFCISVRECCVNYYFSGKNFEHVKRNPVEVKKGTAGIIVDLKISEEKFLKWFLLQKQISHRINI